MAVPSENPIVAANLPLILSRAPGTDSAIEALRLSLLGVASVHQSFLLSRSGLAANGAAEAMAMAHNFRLKSKQHLVKACQTVSGAQSDAALGASLAISLMDVSEANLCDRCLQRWLMSALRSSLAATIGKETWNLQKH
jgi:hypothetical protein